MGIKFTKMHGLGNGYIFLDCFRQDPPSDPAALSIRVSDPYFGVGSDGLVLMLPTQNADCRMRIFNADGSEAQMCGNATRCIGRYLYEQGYIQGKSATLETASGIKVIEITADENGAFLGATVDMGEPGLAPDSLPVTASATPVIGLTMPEAEGLSFTCVSMGNPHAVAFLDCDPKDYPVTSVGPRVEHSPLFPQRVNVEFAQVVSRDKILMRVWERGSGETMACGTGACAVYVAARLNGLVNSEADVVLPGGVLHIRWDEGNNRVYMTGPASIPFTGEWLEG